MPTPVEEVAKPAVEEVPAEPKNFSWANLVGGAGSSAVAVVSPMTSSMNQVGYAVCHWENEREGLSSFFLKFQNVASLAEISQQQQIEESTTPVVEKEQAPVAPRSNRFVLIINALIFLL